MTRAPHLAAHLAAALLLSAAPALLRAQASPAASAAPLDSALVALTYHKLTGEPLDLPAVAASSEAVRRASSFDRRDATAAALARLEAQLADAAPAREFTVRVDDAITDYDHDRGEFSVGLFRPGYYVPVQAFGQEYRLVFANAEAARAIRMPREQARAFDARLQAGGRRVTDELRFRVVGGGDPAGAVTGARVVRAELVAVRLLDAAGAVVHTPSLAAAPAVAAAPFDAARADVAGLRVGVKARAMEGTLRRLFGPVSRGAAGGAAGGAAARYAATLEVNGMGCVDVPGRRRAAAPGAVCVTAFLDADDVVRAVRVERVFPPVDAELFRRALVQKYGPVSGAGDAGALTLGWGPAVDAALVYDRAGPHTALTARYAAAADFLSAGLNRRPDVHVVLQLVDAAWAAAPRAR